MKSLLKALCVTMLMLALASSTLAGDIQHPIVSPTPVTTDGIMQTDEPEPATTDAVTEAALALLQSLLALV